MKSKILLVIPVAFLVALAAWFVHVPDSAQADEIPEKYRETVSKGLEYLARNQHKDGHWEGTDGQHPVAMTGLVGLAMLLEGRQGDREKRIQSPESKYEANVRKAVDWLISKSQPGRGGLIYSEHPSETDRYMQGHGLATLFLAGAISGEKDDKRKQKIIDTVSRAVKYIVKAQSTEGGWYHTSKVEGHDLNEIWATVIQIQALLAAGAYIPVPNEVLVVGDAQVYLKKSIEMIDEKQILSRVDDVAAALAGCMHSARSESKEQLIDKWLRDCRCQVSVLSKPAELFRHEMGHYYLAQAAYSLQSDWEHYRGPVFDHLRSNQNKDGSWPAPPPSRHAISVGQVYATAVWCTILQLDKRNHPSMAWPEVDVK